MTTAFLRLTFLALVSFTTLAASSKIWQGVIVRIEGSVFVIDPQYTPYASATLYPKHCDTADQEGEFLRIDAKSIHVPFIRAVY